MRNFSMSLAEYCRRNNLSSLLSEYVKGNPLTPEEIGYSSTVEVNWKCSFGHTETESVQKRLRRGYCKTCGKNRSGSFGQKYPEAAKLWSPKNKFTAYEVSPTYSAPILWRCEKGHEWERLIWQQLAATSPCPFCRDENNNLFHCYPKLLDEWDAQKNFGVCTSEISVMSTVPYHWICSRGHEFTASPLERTRRNKGCPICKSIAVRYPDAASEWSERNEMKAEDVSPFTHKEAWFRCRTCGSEYLEEIAKRCRRKSFICPHCTHR